MRKQAVECFKCLTTDQFVVVSLVAVSVQAAVATRVHRAHAIIDNSPCMLNEPYELISNQPNVSGTAWNRVEDDQCSTSTTWKWTQCSVNILSGDAKYRGCGKQGLQSATRLYPAERPLQI